MAETEQVQAPAPTQEQLDLDALAAFAFNQPIVPSESSPAIIPSTVEATITPSQNQEISDDEIVDANAYIKEHFGVDSMDVLRERWAELNKPQAQTQAELQFANEQSKKIYENIRAGKTKEVREYLEAQELLTNSDALAEDAKLKLFIKMTNPMYDQELVDLRFNKDYGFDDKPFKDEDGNITDQMGYKLAKIDALQRIKNDTTKADTFFAEYKTKIELPNIQPTQVADQKDYEDYKASIAQSTQIYQTVTVPSLNALKETDVPLNVSINDPGNQMQFDIGIAVDKTDFDKARNYALNFNDWLNQKFYDQNGTFQAAKFQRAILLEENFDKYAQTIARQAVNAERKRVIAKETGGVSPNREQVEVVPDQLAEYAKFAFRENGKGN